MENASDFRGIYVDIKFSKFENFEFSKVNFRIFEFTKKKKNYFLMNLKFPNSRRSHIHENIIQISYFGTYQTQISYKK